MMNQIVVIDVLKYVRYQTVVRGDWLQVMKSVGVVLLRHLHWREDDQGERGRMEEVACGVLESNGGS